MDSPTKLQNATEADILAANAHAKEPLLQDFEPATESPINLHEILKNNGELSVTFWHRNKTTMCVIRIDRGMEVYMTSIAYGSAHCAPEDTFNSLTGKRLALRRAMKVSNLNKDERSKLKAAWRDAERKVRRDKMLDEVVANYLNHVAIRLYASSADRENLPRASRTKRSHPGATSND